MTYDQTFFLLGALGAEQPLSNNNADLPTLTEDMVKEVRLPTAELARNRVAKPLLHWQFHYSWLPGKRRDVYDGGMSRNDLWALYSADAEMSFMEPNSQGSWNTYFVRFAAGSWQQQILQRNGDYYAWDVGFELVQTQPGPLAMNYSAVILREQGLLRYYRLGESAGTNAADASQYAQTGTYTGGFTLAQAGALSGDPDKACSFNGSTGYVSIPSTNLSFASHAPFSIECWLNPSSLAGPGIMSNGGSATDQAILLYMTGSGAIVASFFNDDRSSIFTITTGSWWHVVWAYDGTKSFVYINGILRNSGSHGPYVGNSASWTIGAHVSGGWFWNGVMDEVAIYNRALSAADVARHYAAAPVNLAGV